MIPGPQKAQSPIKAVFFDVDFTLIFPGPTFQAEGYRRACAAHGIEVDPEKFEEATAASSFILDEVEDQIYKHDIFIHYTASIIEHMGGRGANVVQVAGEIYDQWSVNHHFELYEDVAPLMVELQKRKLILVPRETPLNLIHIKNMELLLLAGATILPANPQFYTGARTAVELADTVVARILDHLGIPNNLAPRWKDEPE